MLPQEIPVEFLPPAASTWSNKQSKHVLSFSDATLVHFVSWIKVEWYREHLNHLRMFLFRKLFLLILRGDIKLPTTLKKWKVTQRQRKRWDFLSRPIGDSDDSLLAVLSLVLWQLFAATSFPPLGAILCTVWTQLHVQSKKSLPHYAGHIVFRHVPKLEITSLQCIGIEVTGGPLKKRKKQVTRRC